LYGVVRCPDGGFLLAGLTGRGAEVAGNFINRNSEVISDYWLVKVDVRGSQEWEKILGGPAWEAWPASILPTSDGGYLLAGSSDSPAGGNKTSPKYGAVDWWVVKLSSTGEVE
jgi:hypothetical protein